MSSSPGGASNPQDVVVVSCEAADEWLNEMSPIALRFRSSDPDQWTFRGHRDATWPSLPTAFREESWRKVRFSPSKHQRPWKQFDEKSQRSLEQSVIGEFFHRADQAGMSLPEDTARTRRRLFDILDSRGLWPPHELWSLVARRLHVQSWCLGILGAEPRDSKHRSKDGDGKLRGRSIWSPLPMRVIRISLLNAVWS